MPTVHLICGGTGAGKTTYAIALAERARAVRFSIDEWMANLFVADRPHPPQVEWASERIQRCERQIWAIGQQLIARNVDVVLDLGLSRRDHRDYVRGQVAQTRAESKLHYLDVSVETRRARVIQRGKQPASPFAFNLTEAMFEAMEGWFEVPSDDELYGAMIVCDD